MIAFPETAEERAYREHVHAKEMAESKHVVRARAHGYIEGKSTGFRQGLAVGIFSAALFFITVYAIGKVVG